jgi:hypothetical protein
MVGSGNCAAIEESRLTVLVGLEIIENQKMSFIRVHSLIQINASGL